MRGCAQQCFEQADFFMSELLLKELCKLKVLNLIWKSERSFGLLTEFYALYTVYNYTIK